MAELTLEESVRQILPTLPLPIQKFFKQQKLGETAHLLMERYALHIDQGTVLERELMLLLLGLENPDEFAEALYAELPISKQTVRDIIVDVNKEVFVPLREEEMSAGGGSASGGKSGAGNMQQPAKSAVPQPPRPQGAAPRPVVTPLAAELPRTPSSVPLREGIYAPPLQSPRYANTPVAENLSAFIRPVQMPLNTGRPVVAPVPSAAPQLPRSISQIPAPASPKATQGTAIDNRKLLEDHEEAHIEFNKVSSVPEVRPSPIIPKVEPQIQPRPIVPVAPVIPAKPYSSDPYREPIE